MKVTYRNEFGFAEVVVNGYNIGFVNGYIFFSGKDGKTYKINIVDVVCISKAEDGELMVENGIKLWIDDVRPAPDGYCHLYTVSGAINHIMAMEDNGQVIGLVDIDHDAGEFVWYGGDYIELLNWFEKTGRNYPIRIHSMNPVGVANMRRIIERNGWTEVM